MTDDKPNPTNNNINTSSFGIFNFHSFLKKFHPVLIPTDIAVYFCCIVTGCLIFYKICRELIYNKNKHGIIPILEGFFPSNLSLKAYIIPISISILVFGLYIIQTISLITGTHDDIINTVTHSTAAIISFVVCVFAIICSPFATIRHSNRSWYGLIVFSIIVYYVCMCIIVTKMVDKSTFCGNEYIGTYKVPLFFIILAILILMVLLMAFIGSYTRKSPNCDDEFDKLKRCIKAFKKCVATKYTSADSTNPADPKNEIDKILNKVTNDISPLIGTLNDDLVKLNKTASETTVETTCYKHIISVILIYIILILLGFNSVILALRPELFIAIIVIQRLWFGSSYAEDIIEAEGPLDPGAKIEHSRTSPNKNQGNYVKVATSGTIRRKSWDIIGMPIVRWLMYISRIDTDAHRHKILFGQTNRKVFSAWETMTPGKIKSSGTNMKKYLMRKRVDKTKLKEHNPLIDDPKDT